MFPVTDTNGGLLRSRPPAAGSDAPAAVWIVPPLVLPHSRCRLRFLPEAALPLVVLPARRVAATAAFLPARQLAATAAFFGFLWCARAVVPFCHPLLVLLRGPPTCIFREDGQRVMAASLMLALQFEMHPIHTFFFFSKTLNKRDCAFCVSNLCPVRVGVNDSLTFCCTSVLGR